MHGAHISWGQLNGSISLASFNCFDELGSLLSNLNGRNGFGLLAKGSGNDKRYWLAHTCVDKRSFEN
jgi:hypothetical protein